jgi:hypothetical protein
MEFPNGSRAAAVSVASHCIQNRVPGPLVPRGVEHRASKRVHLIAPE